MCLYGAHIEGMDGTTSGKEQGLGPGTMILVKKHPIPAGGNCMALDAVAAKRKNHTQNGASPFLENYGNKARVQRSLITNHQ
jgi:hypothetical protein